MRNGYPLLALCSMEVELLPPIRFVRAWITSPRVADVAQKGLDSKLWTFGGAHTLLSLNIYYLLIFSMGVGTGLGGGLGLKVKYFFEKFPLNDYTLS